jgi:hypothetical protein
MPDETRGSTAKLVKGLGYASLGLGLSEICMPGRVAAVAGVDDTDATRKVLRVLGVRECGHGVALLSGPAKLVWTRVAGDVLDMGLLLAGVARRPPGMRRQGAIAAAALAVIGAADFYAALRTSGTVAV